MRKSVVALMMVGIGLLAKPVLGVVIQSDSGLSSVGSHVSFQAELSISGDTLTVTLRNVSPESSSAPNDLLSSYYFDIVRSDGARPALSFGSAVGDVWCTYRSSGDVLKTSDADLKATLGGDSTWEFLPMNAAVNPFLGFGIGTVGNNNLTPNNFDGSIVDGMDYSIYTGEVTTQNLNNRLLVKDSMIFTFSGVSGFSEGDISPRHMFGMGTAPDSLLTPEPVTLVLLSMSSLSLLRRRR